ncbi:hypothetical protein [Deinococcus yunweiensis]|uniref:hypothetical protein n=1 Tax=Deinococcus yunweiensis TaxID=367282 RepID=UPI00398ECB21
MTVLPMPPYRVLELAREYAALTTPVERSALYAEWLRRYGDDPAYDLFVNALALLRFDEDPADFRAHYTHPGFGDDEIRAAVAALSDDALSAASEALRIAYLQRTEDDVRDVWHLVKVQAGVA